MIDPMQMDETIRKEGMKPIFADGILISFRFKGKPKDSETKGIQNTGVQPQDIRIDSGLLEILFVDSSKNQPLGRFVVDRQTAGEISNILNDTIKKFDEMMQKKDISTFLPKDSTDKSATQSYR